MTAPQVIRRARDKLFVGRTLASKFVLSLAAIVSAAMVTNAGLHVYFSYAEHVANARALQREQAAALSDRIDQFFAELQSQVGWTLQLPWSATAPEQRQFDALRLLRQSPAITEFRQIDPAGKEQVRVSRLALNSYGSGLDFSTDLLFKQPVSGKPHFSEVYFHRGSEPHIKVGYVGARRDSGVSIAEVNLKFVWDLLSEVKLGGEGKTFVVDAAGRLIAHQDISMALRNIDTSGSAQFALAGIKGALGAAPVRDFSGNWVLSESTQLKSLPWIVFVDRPYAEALGPLKDTALRTVYILFFGIACAISAAILLTRPLVGPIRALQRGAIEVGSGKLTTRIKITSGDELQVLAEQFNLMADRVLEAQRHLEARIAERTDQLARSLQDLRTLAEVSQKVNSSLILDHVLESIVSGAVKISGATAGVICEVLPETRRSVVLASVGEDIVEMRRLFASADADLESPLFEAVKTKRQVYVPDTELMPPSLLRTELIRRGVLSAVCIPLLHSEEVVGGLIVRSSQKYMFSPDTIQSLSTFASQSVLAIVNARLFKALEERSGQLDLASRHKSQFLANMSHELRTPLNAIIGYSELLSEGMYGPLPERAGKVLERVLVNGRHLLSLINDVLDLSRIEAGEFKLAIGPYSPRSILEQVRATMTPIAERKGLILELNGPESPDVYRGDEVRITQVLMNLVGNALKFTDEGRVIVSVRREDRHLVYSVVDTGPGISLEDHERIFGEFQQVDSSTTKRVSGSGLGLAISRRISALHGGHIRVVSALGAGATFELVLPTDEVDEVGS